MKKVLFLCTGNSCRSQIAEAIVNARLGDSWQAFSAGTKPAGFIHPRAFEVLREIGIEHQGSSKRAEEFRDEDFDLVVTVCDSAAEECPVWLGKGTRIHYNFPDPARAEGTDEEIMNVFRAVRDDIESELIPFLRARVNEHNEIILPAGLARDLSLAPGDEIRVEPNGRGVYLHPSIHGLRRVYVEITNKCNLSCSTCMRNVWDVEYGHISDQVLERILSGLDECTEKPEIFMGGYGEPLFHPKALRLIEQAKERGYRVSLITNGILLTENVARKLINLKLDMLWVSLDGASAECYADVRLGDMLPVVLKNLTYLRSMKYRQFGLSLWSGYPKLGIAFVAMKRNIRDLGEVIRLGSRLGATEFSVSNVLAHDASLLAENLYTQSLDMVTSQEIRPTVHVPLMDIQPHTLKALGEVMVDLNQLELTGSFLNRNMDQCPFIERGSMAVRWDGRVSPCLPLLYTHKHYLGNRVRTSKEYFVGDVHDHDLLNIWNDAKYRELRKRLQDFDFSPCAFCNSCEMALENLEDCFGNTQPTCGGCLWAQGLIRCP